jgi:polysaccharide biosynthesis protein PslJ
MALALPFGIHFGLFGPTPRARKIYWFLTALIAAAIPLTVARTGIICAGLALLTLAFLWTWRLRYNLLVVVVFFGAAAAGAKPTLVGTLLGMFTGASEDPSITSRTDRYTMVYYYFVQRPWLGRGTGTWVWPQYQYLDNQWFATALMNGIFGVIFLAALHICAIVLAGIAWRRATSIADKHMCAALVSTQITAVLASATFDSLSFGTYVELISILIGLCGAVWRLTHSDRPVRTATVSGREIQPDTVRLSVRG